MKYLLFLILVLFAAFSCTSSKKITPREDVIVEETSEYDERFDPLSLDDDDIVIEASEKQQKETKPERPSRKPEDKVQEFTTEQEVDGYRIQVYASRSIEGATVAQQKAKDEFEPLGHKVYMIFETPFYKIRIADLQDRTKAEEVLEIVKSMGYDQSFLVFGRIILQKSVDNNMNEQGF